MKANLSSTELGLTSQLELSLAIFLHACSEEKIANEKKIYKENRMVTTQGQLPSTNKGNSTTSKTQYALILKVRHSWNKSNLTSQNICYFKHINPNYETNSNKMAQKFTKYLIAFLFILLVAK